MAEPTQQLQNDEANREVPWHFCLAVLALLAYIGVSVWFAYCPSKLPGDTTGAVLDNLKGLTVLSWSYVFFRHAFVTK